MLSNGTLLFRATLVWSTCTNYSPVLPNWWAMLYFNSTACVDPYDNPSGDGIDNWDKYLLGLNPNIAYASQLFLTPPGGNYVATPAITIFSLAGPSIKYTTDGSTPSATHGTAVASGVLLTNLPTANFTLKAWASGLTPNVPASATYTIIPATPSFSLPEGTYVQGTTLQISCATTNAIVRYTTNGIDPATNSLQIQPTNILTLTTNVTIKAAAWLGTNVSPVGCEAYLVTIAPGTPPTPPPPANDNFSNAIVFSGSAGSIEGTTVSATLEAFETNNFYEFETANLAGNSVWYQWTAPSNGNVFFYDGLEYPSFYYYPTGVSHNPTNLVAATSSQSDSDYSATLVATQSVTYYISVSASSPGPFTLQWQYVATGDGPPIFSPPAGNYYAGQSVTILCADPNAVIYYTTSGSNPTTNDPVVPSSGSLTLYQTTTLKAVTWRTGLDESAVTTALYTIQAETTNAELAGPPTLSPANVIFTNSLTVTLTCTNVGGIIYYTLDGTTPATASASVTSGGTVTFTNSAIISAITWASNLNLSPIASSQYAKWGVDTAGDGIPDSSKLLIGANILASDADDVNPNPFAHGLDNMQVYENPSVLIGNNYSTENDSMPDWWLVQNGYSVTTSASALGANGQTLLSSYLAGLLPNNPNSQPGQLPPVDFHMVHGPTNSLVMVLDTVRSGMGGYLLTCVNTDQGLPSVLEEFPANQSMDDPSQGLGRYFQMTNSLPPGFWYFTLQGVNTNTLWSTTSSNTFEQITEDFNGTSDEAGASLNIGTPIPVDNYTNQITQRELMLAQLLRGESDVWTFGTTLEDALWSTLTVALYDDAVPQPLIAQQSWGTFTFEYNTNFYGYNAYYPIADASYFTPAADLNTNIYYDWAYHWNADAYGLPNTELGPLAVLYDAHDNPYFYMPPDSWTNDGAQYRFNPAGLEYISVTYRIGTTDVTLSPGDSNAIPNMEFAFEAALQTETNTFQATNYYFDARDYPLSDNADEGNPSLRSSPPVTDYGPYVADGWIPLSVYPISVSVTNPVIVAQVGKPVHLQAWSAVIAVRPNGQQITNTTYWMDQDFEQAYLCSPTNGDVPRTSQPNVNGKMKIDTNSAVTTGILSPNIDYTNINANTYPQIFPTRGADFTPTVPGKVIITTMADANGNYGEVTIYVIDIQVDANHDGLMDNRDLTSVDNPDVLWVNNDIDRGHVVDGDDWEQDDLNTNDPSLNAATDVPDCNFIDPSTGAYAIPSQRDLEDYFRLWISGFSNMVANLPTNYTVTLQWRNNTGAAIRLFRAAETNGGTNYLFETNIANLQTNYSLNPCCGYVLPNRPLDVGTEFRTWTEAPPPNDHFIFCGSSYGNDELVLQVTDPVGAVVGEASVFLNLKDIKQMYERWTVGDNPEQTPTAIATPAYNDLPSGVGSFQYSYDGGVNSTTPYILFVHGFNLPVWKKDRLMAETAYKRLYWQGYQGRFGSFRWPCNADPLAFDQDELTAWESGAGLKNRLVALNIQYPGNVYLLAHSLGNVVSGEALREAGASEIVNTYVASQAALSAHAYDNTIPADAATYYTPTTPDSEGHYYTNGAPPYFNGTVGAGTYVDYYNPVDWALTGSTLLQPGWLYDQEYKPDINYHYQTPNTNDPSGYYQEIGYIETALLFTNDTYQIFGMCVQSYSEALGAETNIGTPFSATPAINLNTAPYNFGSLHIGHSAQFRSDNMTRAVYWNQLLHSYTLK
jgi:hypothetical protein